MKMISTRDDNKTARSYTDVLLQGLAPDGGLYVPNKYPKFTIEEIENLKGETYQKIAFAVKKKLIDGAIPDRDLKILINKAYTLELFEGTQDGEVVPLTKVENNFYVQNLSLGPTATFKDIALQQLGQEMDYELGKRAEELIILGATSGDTGSSAEVAFKGLRRVKLFMLSPKDGMSEFQKAQMGSLTGDNIFNISVRGRFDDCQDLVKELKQDPEFAKLGAVNSINWGRISSQVPYYFAGYLQVVDRVGDEVDYCVPSGNFGNVLSGFIAKKMGLPIRRLIVATNENTVLHRLITTGTYELTPAQITSSPSMDISKASNYERLVFDIFNNDAEKTRAYMEEFEQTGSVALSEYGVGNTVFEDMGFASGMSTHQDRIKTIKDVYDKTDTVIDPHTADGVSVARQYTQGDMVPMVCMQTALAVKFEDTVKEALGFTPERAERFVGLEERVTPGSFKVIDVDEEQLKEYIKAYI